MTRTPPSAEAGLRALLWHWVRRPGWSAIAPILLLGFAGVFAWQIFFSSSEIELGLAALNATFRDARPFEARLSGFGYAPQETHRGKFDEQKFKTAEEYLVTKTQQLSTPAAIYARGKYHLAMNKLDEAIQHFERALKESPNLAPLHNDLGVAWLEKATARRTMADAAQWFVQSQNEFEQALKLDRNLSEALFNIALLKFRLGLWEEAEESWQAYLLHDARSGWAQEAKEYLSRIKTLKLQTIKSNV